MEQLTLWQRFRAKTPVFFKRAQAIGLAMVVFGEGILKIQYLPEKFSLLAQSLICTGGAIAFISQFVVEHQPDKTK